MAGPVPSKHASLTLKTFLRLPTPRLSTNTRFHVTIIYDLGAKTIVCMSRRRHDLATGNPAKLGEAGRPRCDDDFPHPPPIWVAGSTQSYKDTPSSGKKANASPGNMWMSCSSLPETRLFLSVAKLCRLGGLAHTIWIQASMLESLSIKWECLPTARSHSYSAGTLHHNFVALF